ncbi:hypothetical protein BDV95DRAFT_141635 [Massariosphaeria phaeospora]|uniref:Uncharacterized protein n=1 Tax=Massariosphaeria phaeospora TaxID=100035 RepID=A0A7C8MGW3_9PLEO|nr:hypothetical protein BDV95DRAFT_141635 [Massariosphaeria phaeospora]
MGFWLCVASMGGGRSGGRCGASWGCKVARRPHVAVLVDGYLRGTYSVLWSRLASGHRSTMRQLVFRVRMDSTPPRQARGRDWNPNVRLLAPVGSITPLGPPTRTVGMVCMSSWGAHPAQLEQDDMHLPSHRKGLGAPQECRTTVSWVEGLW